MDKINIDILQALKREPLGMESQVIRDQVVGEVKLKETDFEGMVTWHLLDDMETIGLIRKTRGIERQGTNSNLWFMQEKVKVYKSIDSTEVVEQIALEKFILIFIEEYQTFGLKVFYLNGKVACETAWGDVIERPLTYDFLMYKLSKNN